MSSAAPKPPFSIAIQNEIAKRKCSQSAVTKTQSRTLTPAKAHLNSGHPFS
jgi:hypothetical protein